MKISDTEAHIGLGSNEVKVGDRVTILKNECQRPPAVWSGVKTDPLCSKVRIGEATILRSLNEDYSVAKVDPGVLFKEMMIVEKE
ncbi:hypothetical protein WDW86_07300 [Bdellovibrionota bacterium FG-2]